MKEKLIAIVFLFWGIICAHASDVKTVGVGSGKTMELATQSALRNALESVYGVFLSSSTTMIDEKILSDKITSVSFGKILTYKVIDSIDNDNGDKIVTVDATVSLKNLASFVGENTGTSVEFDGESWGMQRKMERLNKQNEEKAAEDILMSILSLDLNSVNKVEILEINIKERGRDTIVTIKVKCDMKDRIDIKALYSLIIDSFEALRDPGSKKFRSPLTAEILNILENYVSCIGSWFAVDDGIGNKYAVSMSYTKDEFSKIANSNSVYQLHLAPDDHGAYFYRSLKRRSSNGWTTYDKDKFEIDLYYSPQELETIKNFLIVPIPQEAASDIKKIFLNAYLSKKSRYSD